MKTLKTSQDTNLLEILVKDIELKPFCEMENGVIESSIKVKIHKYSLEDVLSQMLDDYGEERIIKEIKQLSI